MKRRCLCTECSYTYHTCSSELSVYTFQLKYLEVVLNYLQICYIILTGHARFLQYNINGFLLLPFYSGSLASVCCIGTVLFQENISQILKVSQKCTFAHSATQVLCSSTFTIRQNQYFVDISCAQRLTHSLCSVRYTVYWNRVAHAIFEPQWLHSILFRYRTDHPKCVIFNFTMLSFNKEFRLLPLCFEFQSLWLRLMRIPIA